MRAVAKKPVYVVALHCGGTAGVSLDAAAQALRDETGSAQHWTTPTQVLSTSANPNAQHLLSINGLFNPV